MPSRIAATAADIPLHYQTFNNYAQIVANKTARHGLHVSPLPEVWVPDRPRTVIVHSLGNHLNVLDEIGWLDGARQLYWGDLDRAGFTLLSRARARLPRLVSLLMDPTTLEEHRTLAVEDKTRADTPYSNLTDNETAALAELSLEHGTFLRLEQERLPSPFTLDQLCRAMEGNGPACLRPARKSEPPPPV